MSSTLGMQPTCRGVPTPEDEGRAQAGTCEVAVLWRATCSRSDACGARVWSAAGCALTVVHNASRLGFVFSYSPIAFLCAIV